MSSIKVLDTTAKYPNRIEDKDLVELLFGLPEFPNSDIDTKIFVSSAKGPMLFAVGYERVVYGDHGPYIEFNRLQIKAFLDYHHNGRPFDENSSVITAGRELGVYYYWLETDPVSVKVYFQVKSVSRLSNAPARPDDKPSRFNRPAGEGYADYKVGFYYISAFDLLAVKNVSTN
jgi:hypothetical protein